MTHGSPLNLANNVLKNLVTSNKIRRVFEFSYYNFSIFVNHWKDGDQHSAKTAVCTNFITVVVKMRILPTNP
jgi:hypothetical protein